jgi:cytochrome c peroxidase
VIRLAATLRLALVAVTAGAMTESEPVAPLQPVQQDSAGVELGGKLFHDARLSRGNVMSCASCHRLASGGDDNQVRASGADGYPLDYNTPTIFNVASNFRFNWRGNFSKLEKQNEAVLLDPRVMNTRWDELLAKLQADAAYRQDFAKLYGGGLTAGAVLDALATFQRSLATPDARFDRRLRGERDAITPEEEQGYALFKSYGCAACHQGAGFGGNLFQKLGIFRDPFGAEAGADLGRSSLTGRDADRKVFRVPSLRNVALTAPYFHNGSTWSLTEAVEIMARSQLGRELPPRDVALIVRFLDTLTGTYQGRPLAAPERAP